MALLRARIRRDPFLPRHFSSSSSSTSSPVPPPPPSEPASSDPPPRSPFADIRDRLRSPTSASASAPRGAAPIDDLRRKLRTFAKSHPSTSSSASSSPGPSFLDVFTTAPSSPPAPNRASPSATRTPLDFIALRDSLNKPGSTAGGLPAPGARKIDLKSSLSQRRRPAGPEAALGRDLGAKGPEFLRQYSYDDLGKRLGGLRPAGTGKDGKEWFSLEELSARLGRLRESDKEERERAPLDRLGIGKLREALETQAHQTKDQKKAGGAPSMATLMGFVGQTVQGKPQEELVERYFHPDHMSSAEKMKLELKRVRDQFKMSENDCGSARVQVAQLTTKIKHLSATLHKKDKHSRKGLQEMVQRRKKYLKYLRRTDWDSYCLVLKSLGLRDVPEYKAPDYKSKSNTKSKTKKKSKRKMKA
ncbi:hypothetical protein SEVIR_4G052901v4 [Setaria viridis]|uniref:Small ribosomal subunit protein uS15c n=1 Tax=Setaria viridis TaxID=4556 RepID=A0A4U6UVW3_SETVI|nr:uncharacterized protein LOC117852714 [Setaria viridis]TKW19942.1 hypothetical protein SEVIR_4G052901v2 [Setaria viridis]TKW19943.1 hypothetical protein SEVIR_4G052901v2 [Setaria viridis]